jgi:hypothetical protein
LKVFFPFFVHFSSPFLGFSLRVYSISLLSLDSFATGGERLISLEVFTGWKIGACEGLF